MENGKILYRWTNFNDDSLVDTGIFLKESKDFLNSTPVNEMDHEMALNAKANIALSLGPEKIAEEYNRVKEMNAMKAMEYLRVLHPEIAKSIYMRKLHELIFNGLGPQQFIMEKLEKQNEDLEPLDVEKLTKENEDLKTDIYDLKNQNCSCVTPLSGTMK